MEAPPSNSREENRPTPTVGIHPRYAKSVGIGSLLRKYVSSQTADEDDTRGSRNGRPGKL